MRTTIITAVAMLAITATVQAQNNAGANRRERPDTRRQFQEPAGPQFRGGDVQQQGRGQYGQQRQGRRGQGGQREVQQDRRRQNCPHCGAPQGNRQGVRDGRGGQGAQGREQAYGERRGLRQGADEMNRPQRQGGPRNGRGQGQERRRGFGPPQRGLGQNPFDDGNWNDRPDSFDGLRDEEERG